MVTLPHDILPFTALGIGGQTWKFRRLAVGSAQAAVRHLYRASGIWQLRRAFRALAIKIPRSPAAVPAGMTAWLLTKSVAVAVPEVLF